MNIYIYIYISHVLGIFLHWSPNSQFLVTVESPRGTEAAIDRRQAGDAAMTCVIFLALGQVMFKQSTYTDSGQYPKLMKMITDTG